MCGIAGRFSPGGGGGEGALVDRMVAAMHHRGPDHSGRFDAPGVALGMARLSIVDVAGGFQPLFDEPGAAFPVRNHIPRFCHNAYCESFAFQWERFTNLRHDSVLKDIQVEYGANGVVGNARRKSGTPVES